MAEVGSVRAAIASPRSVTASPTAGPITRHRFVSTRRLVANLETLVPLAPLHQPHNLAPIRAILARAPELPQVACFDTAMHRSNPRLAQMFGLPKELDDAGVRRFGFHGLSYEYIATVLPKFDERAARGKTVVLHLGNGASMCALAAGRSVASTMGFTAVDGLPMGTRSGALDPGVILYLMDQRGMDARAIEKLIYKQSGLLGISGVSSDMRALCESSDPRAALAIDFFVYRIGRELGSLAAALGGLDAMVFTAGIGQHEAKVRERVCRQAAWLGVELDQAANAGKRPSHQHRLEPNCRLGDSNQRRADDRAAHARPSRERLTWQEPTITFWPARRRSSSASPTSTPSRTAARTPSVAWARTWHSPI